LLRRLPVVAVAGAGALALPVPLAAAGLVEGDAPPALEGKEFINTGEVSFESLRGKLVLCEVFSPT
jgi:hypothetical protein